jgi:hypothetical protein
LALRLALARPATDDEIQRGERLLRGWTVEDGASTEDALRYFCLLVLNLNEVIYVD